MSGNHLEDGGWIYIYTLENNDYKIGRTSRPNPEIRFKEQSQYQDKSDIKAWWCRSHVVAETVILKLLAKARRRNTEGNLVEVFKSAIIGRTTAELAIQEVVEEIKRKMQEEDGPNEEASDLQTLCCDSQHS